MIALSVAGSFTVSKHASTRMAQRGIQAHILDLLLTHGDQSKTCGGCECYCLLGRTAEQLRNAGLDAEVLDAATKLCAVVSADGTVVTCYHGDHETRRRPRKTTHHRRYALKHEHGATGSR